MTARPSGASRRVASLALTILAIMGLAACGTDPPAHPGAGEARGPIVRELGGPGQASVTTSRPAAAEVERTQAAGHGGERSEQPAGVSAAQLDAGREQQERYAARDDLPAVTPDAAPQQRGCATRLVRNFSSRRGVRPRLLVVHYTVSPNRPGTADVGAIVGLFDRPSFAASSHYVIDADGNCAYIVRESDKSWTQAAANPVSISVEMIATGREGRLAGPAGYRKLGQVFSDAARRWKIPIQKGAVSGCRVTRPGIVQHKDLGACGGGHVDITPYSTNSVIAATKAARSGRAAQAPRNVRRWCGAIRWWRRAGRPHGQPERNAIARRKLIAKRGYVCPTRGPARRRR